MVHGIVPAVHVEIGMNEAVYEQAHKFVLMNHPSIGKWMDCHNEAKQRISELAPFKHWVRGAVLGTMNAEDFISQEILDISAGPSNKAKYYTSMQFTLSYFLLSFFWTSM
jgi:hypothetical protein